MRTMQTMLVTLTLLLVAGCMPTRVPEPSPDNKAPAPANGIIEIPTRPNNIPDNFLSFTWIIEFEDPNGRPYSVSAMVTVTADSNAPVQGNVRGGYPYTIWTMTPYSHTMWYEPGIVIDTRVNVVANPELPPDLIQKGVHAVCSASDGHETEQYIEEPQYDQEIANCHALLD